MFSTGYRIRGSSRISGETFLAQIQKCNKIQKRKLSGWFKKIPALFLKIGCSAKFKLD